MQPTENERCGRDHTINISNVGKLNIEHLNQNEIILEGVYSIVPMPGWGSGIFCGVHSIGNIMSLYVLCVCMCVCMCVCVCVCLCVCVCVCVCCVCVCVCVCTEWTLAATVFVCVCVFVFVCVCFC